MSLLLGQILNGIATGMLYALMGLGLSLITGILNIPNFAHGALFAVGAYLLVTVVGLVGNFWLGLLIAPLGVALLGLLIAGLVFAWFCVHVLMPRIGRAAAAAGSRPAAPGSR